MRKNINKRELNCVLKDLEWVIFGDRFRWNGFLLVWVDGDCFFFTSKCFFYWFHFEIILNFPVDWAFVGGIKMIWIAMMHSDYACRFKLIILLVKICGFWEENWLNFQSCDRIFLLIIFYIHKFNWFSIKTHINIQATNNFHWTLFPIEKKGCF